MRNLLKKSMVMMTIAGMILSSLSPLQIYAEEPDTAVLDEGASGENQGNPSDEGIVVEDLRDNTDREINIDIEPYESDVAEEEAPVERESNPAEPENLAEQDIKDCKDIEDVELVDQEATVEMENMDVTVSGEMPENSEIVVSELDEDQTDTARMLVEELTDEKTYVEPLGVYDIKVLDGNGEEFQPEDYDGTLNVSFAGLDVDLNTDECSEERVVIYHIKDEEKITEMETATDDSDVVTEASCDTESFSWYLVGKEYVEHKEIFERSFFTDPYSGRGVPADIRTNRDRYKGYELIIRYIDTENYDYSKGLTAELKDFDLSGEDAGEVEYPVLKNNYLLKTIEEYEPAPQMQRYLKEAVIDEGVKMIPRYVFRRCENLEKVTLPSTLTEIGSFAFSQCGIKEINFQDCPKLYCIGDSAFYDGIEGQIAVDLRGKTGVLLDIGSSAFAETNITKFLAPEKYTCNSNTGVGAFTNCWYLTQCTLPAVNKGIGRAFNGCSNLTLTISNDFINSDETQYNMDGVSIEIEGGHPYELNFPGDVKGFNGAYFNRINKISSPGKITGFNNANGLSQCYRWTDGEVYGGDIVLECTSIGDNSFNNTNLKIKLPDTLTSIGHSCFCGPNSVYDYVTIPAGVTGDINYCFNDSYMAHVKVEGAVKIANSFNRCAYLADVDKTNAISVGDSFQNCPKLSEDYQTNVTPPGETTSWPIVLTKAYKTSEDVYYNGCYAKYKYPEGILTVHGTECSRDTYNPLNPTYSKYKLAKMPPLNTVCDNYYYIKKVVFENCDIVECDNDTFSHIEGLQEVDFGGAKIGLNNCVPAQLFYKCKDLKKVTLPNDLWQIGQEAFADCPNLEEVNIADTVAVIDKSAFSGDVKLTITKLPSSLENLYEYAFKDCGTSLSGGQVTISELPAGLKFLDMSAFDNCGYGVSFSEIPSSVTKIKGHLLNNGIKVTEIKASTVDIAYIEKCSKLTDLTLYSNAHIIDCYGLKKLTLSGTCSNYGSENSDYLRYWYVGGGCTSLQTIVLDNYCNKKGPVLISFDCYHLDLRAGWQQSSRAEEINYYGSPFKGDDGVYYKSLAKNKTYNVTLTRQKNDQWVFPNTIASYDGDKTFTVKHVEPEEVVEQFNDKTDSDINNYSIEKNTNWIDDYRFDKTYATYKDKVTKFVIEDGVETCPAGFNNSASLEEVYLGNVKYIRPNSFIMCPKLTKIYGGSQVENVMTPKPASSSYYETELGDPKRPLSTSPDTWTDNNNTPAFLAAVLTPTSIDSTASSVLKSYDWETVNRLGGFAKITLDYQNPANEVKYLYVTTSGVYSSDDVYSVVSDSDDAYLKRVLTQINHLPKNVRDVFFGQGGNVVKIISQAQMTSEHGTPAVGGGVYTGNCTGKPENGRVYYTISVVPDELEACVWHEFGHFMDSVLGNVSTSAAFTQIAASEMSGSGLGEYFLADQKEYFAEMFQSYVGGDSAAATACPQTMAFIEQCVTNMGSHTPSPSYKGTINMPTWSAAASGLAGFTEYTSGANKGLQGFYTEKNGAGTKKIPCTNPKASRLAVENSVKNITDSITLYGFWGEVEGQISDDDIISICYRSEKDNKDGLSKDGSPKHIGWTRQITYGEYKSLVKKTSNDEAMEKMFKDQVFGTKSITLNERMYPVVPASGSALAGQEFAYFVSDGQPYEINAVDHGIAYRWAINWYATYKNKEGQTDTPIAVRLHHNGGSADYDVVYVNTTDHKIYPTEEAAKAKTGAINGITSTAPIGKKLKGYYAVDEDDTSDLLVNASNGYFTSLLKGGTYANAYAIWDDAIFTITLDHQGGTADRRELYVNTVTHKVYGTLTDAQNMKSPVSTINKPDSKGKKFMGYFTEKNGAGTMKINPNGGVSALNNESSDLTVYAYWTDYAIAKVTLDHQGGTNDIDVIYVYEKNQKFYPSRDDALNEANEITTFNKPDRTGKVYKNYWTEKNGAGTVRINGVSLSPLKGVTADETIYANWEDETFRVTWADQFKDPTSWSETVTYGTQLTFPEPAGNSEWKFLGWSVDGDTNHLYRPGDKTPAITTNTRLKAEYSHIDQKVLKFVDRKATPNSEIYSAHFNIGTPIPDDIPEDPVRENTTFLGWQRSGDSKVLYQRADIVGKELNESRTYTARYEDDPSYRVRFVINGTTISDKVYEASDIGNAIEVPNDPNPADYGVTDGKAFYGWRSSETKEIYLKDEIPVLSGASKVLTYSAVLKMPPHAHVIFRNDDTGHTVLSDEVYTEGEAVVVPAEPELDGRAFEYWSSSKGGHYASSEIPTAEVGTTVYTAHHKNGGSSGPDPGARYTIRFLSDDGTEDYSLKNPYGAGEAYVVPENLPDKDANRVFLGWKSGSDGKTYTKEQLETFTAEKSITYRAKFKEPDIRVVFRNGSETLSTEWYFAGQSVVKPANPVSPDGYAFVGWRDSNTKEIIDPDTNITAYKNVVYTACFDKPPVYRITFVNTGDVPYTNSRYYMEGDTVEVPADPVKEGSTFLGWKSNISGEEDVLYQRDTIPAVTQTVTYRSYFPAVKKEIKNVRFINFKDTDYVAFDGYWLQKSRRYPAGDPLEVPENPVYKGMRGKYTFDKWEPTAVAGSPVTSDADYQAKYNLQPIKYLYIYKDYDGTEIKRQECDYGETPTAPNKPTRAVGADGTKYTFKKWEQDKNVREAYEEWYTAGQDMSKNPTIIRTATYNELPKTVKVTFKNWNNSTISTKNYKVGDKVEIPKDPERPADKQYTYRFKGWSPEVEATAKEDVTYKAEYEQTRQKYLIKFVDDDGSFISEQMLEYGSTPDKPNDPEKSATDTQTFKFAGWTPSVTKVTQAQTYTARYTASTKKVTTPTPTPTPKPTVTPTPTPTPKPTTTPKPTATPTPTKAPGKVTPTPTPSPSKDTKKKYTVKFVKPTGETIKTITATEGTKITAPKVSSYKEGDKEYKFDSWSPVFNDIVTGDATYEARYVLGVRTTPTPTATPTPAAEVPPVMIVDSSGSEIVNKDLDWDKQDNPNRDIAKIAAIIGAGLLTVGAIVTALFTNWWLLLLNLLFIKKRKKWHGILTDEENRFINLEGPLVGDTYELAQDVINRAEDDKLGVKDTLERLIETGNITKMPYNTKMTISTITENGTETSKEMPADEQKAYDYLLTYENTGITALVSIFNPKCHIDIELKYRL